MPLWRHYDAIMTPLWRHYDAIILAVMTPPSGQKKIAAPPMKNYKYAHDGGLTTSHLYVHYTFFMTANLWDDPLNTCCIGAGKFLDVAW